MGYDNRVLANSDFRNDDVDAGEMGAGQGVTAIYAVQLRASDRSANFASVTVRYKTPGGLWAHEVSRKIARNQIAPSFQAAGDDTRLAICAACLAESLKRTYWSRQYNLDNVLAMAHSIRVDAPRQAELDDLLATISAARACPAGRPRRPPRPTRP